MLLGNYYKGKIMKHKKHMDADVKARVKPVDSDEDGKVSSKEKNRADEIGDALNKVFKKHMKKDEEKDEDENEDHEDHEEGDEDEKGSKGLTKAQMKLPPKLRAAILKSKGKKHMDADEEDSDEGDDEGLENPDKADLDKDGELSSYEIKRGKAIEASMKGKKHCGMYMDKDACDCGAEKEEDCTCNEKDHKKEEKKENHWYGRSLPTFNEWLRWRETQG